MLEIMLFLGKQEKVVALDISEYNPFVEDWRTGRLVATLYYQYLLGRAINN